MEAARLYEIIEKKRREGENMSFPFLVRTGENTIRYVWFAFNAAGNVNTGAFVHISRIMVLRHDNEPLPFPAGFTVPYLTDQSSQGNYMEYLQKLTELEDRFSEEEMNRLLQDYGMKPLFQACQCVRNYVRTHEKELLRKEETENAGARRPQQNAMEILKALTQKAPANEQNPGKEPADS